LSDRLLDLPDDDALADELANVQLREMSPGVYRMDHSADRHDDRAVALALGAHTLLNTPPRRTLRFRGAA
jgi:phage FluMu gp28-like protein